ncbi:MAG: hypothetical protein P8Y48_17565 [Novosphingobium sp.]
MWRDALDHFVLDPTALSRDWFRAGQVRRTGDLQADFTRCVRVAEGVLLRRYTRPWSLARMEATLDTFADDVSLNRSPG